MKRFLALFGFLMLMLLPFAALADDPSLPVGDFLSQVLQAVQGFGGMSWALKVSTVCLLLVGSMKVDVISHAFWDKLGNAKPFVAPILGIVGGLLALGTKITLPQAMAYLGAGVGANFLFALLDAIKVPAASNSFVMAVIGIIQGILNKGEPPAQQK